MTKDDFLVAVKLATGIEIKLGHEYYLGQGKGIIRPLEFMFDGIMYKYTLFGYIKSRAQGRTSFMSFYQIMDCIDDIREIFPDKIHHMCMIHP